MIQRKKEGFLSLLPLMKPHTRLLIWGGICTIIYVGCWPLLAWLVGKLIPAIGSGNINEVLNVICLALVVFLIQKTAQFAQDTLYAGPALRISQQLRKDLFSGLQEVQLGSIEKLSSGDLTYRLTEDADRVGEVIYKTIQDTTPSLLQLIAVFGYMIYLDWKLSVATILLAPLVAILVGNFGSRVMVAAEKSQKQVSDLAGLLGEAIQGLPLVRAFAAEDWLQKRFDDEIDLHRKARYRTLRLLALQHPVVGFIEASGILTVLAIGAIRINSGELDGAGFSSYVAALLMLIDPISHLTLNFNEYKQGQASLKRLIEIEQEPKERPDNYNSKDIVSPKGEIVLENIDFEYIRLEKVLDSLNLNIPAGKVTALVGPSGAGKSTIFSLLLRMNNPDSGRILLDGENISELKSKQIRKVLALVPQRVSVFSGTISDAISFGREVRDEDIVRASKIANAHEFIINMPKGYDTLLEERGTNVSGGQLQRIAIARAVLGNPAVLLLDEATSALDGEAENAVQVGLSQAMKDRTVLIIAHRLSTVQEADQIVFMEKGHIQEIGTHEELMSGKGRYRELCEKQFIKQSEKIEA